MYKRQQQGRTGVNRGVRIARLTDYVNGDVGGGKRAQAHLKSLRSAFRNSDRTWIDFDLWTSQDIDGENLVVGRALNVGYTNPDAASRAVTVIQDSRCLDDSLCGAVREKLWYRELAVMGAARAGN